MGITRRVALMGVGALGGAWVARKVGPDLPSMTGSRSLAPTGRAGTLNDASLLEETPVASHVVIKDDPGVTLVEALRAELKAAADEGRPVNIGAARHSMGGQAIPRDGRAITFDSRFIEVDWNQGFYRCQAGMRWSDVIAAIDKLGFSPKVMQSNNDFGVAATYSVNAHGWPVTWGPAGSTVRSVEMVLPDGSLVTASRTENTELFRAAMGGYGLVGLITQLELDMVPNQMLLPTFAQMPASGFAEAFVQELKDRSVSMAYGRLNVDRAHFFEEAMLIAYRPEGSQTVVPGAQGSGFVSRASRHVFRAQLGNEWVKDLRWGIEARVGPLLAGKVTRNTLLNEPVVTLDDRDPGRTDILHEYFLPPDRFADFCTLCRDVIRSSYQELLNVTLRYVDADPESMLAYAPQPRIAAVMLFSQAMTVHAEADMARMTRDLIDGVIGLGGSYYLPYRPHANLGQLVEAYPGVADFVRAKREVDPGLLLRNGLWDSYLGRI